MSQYISGTIMILLLAFFTLLGMQAYSLVDTTRAVTVAVEETAPALRQAGGVSDAVRESLTENLTGEGLNPAQAEVEGTPAGQSWGSLVTLQVTYRRPYTLARLLSGLGFGQESHMLQITRHVTVVSEAVP